MPAAVSALQEAEVAAAYAASPAARSVDPTMLPCLDEPWKELLARRAFAVAEDWRGQIDGLDLTPTFLLSKREPARRHERTGPVPFGPSAVPHQGLQLAEGESGERGREAQPGTRSPGAYASGSSGPSAPSLAGNCAGVVR